MSKQWRILHTEASTGWGGQEIRIITEMAGMARRGYHTLLVCREGSVISQRAPEQGIETIIAPLDGAFDVTGIQRLRTLLREREIDIVNTHSSKDSWTAGLAARLCGGVKVIRTRHLSIPIKKTFEARLLYRSLCDVIVATGESLRDDIMVQTGLPPERVLSIPTGINLDKFNPFSVKETLRKELGFTSDTPLIGTIGMMRGMKGHKYYLDAAAQIVKQYPEARFLIVGDTAFSSPIKEHLATQMAELGITDKVTMTGYREDIPEVLAALDVFVLASIRNEGVPQVISQAMAMKKPIVATDVGSIREQVIDGVTGYLVEKSNADQIANAVLRILASPEKAARMGEEGRMHAERNFSIEGMLDRTEALYERLIESRQGE